jgi:hypothetical protein
LSYPLSYREDYETRRVITQDGKSCSKQAGFHKPPETPRNQALIFEAGNSVRRVSLEKLLKKATTALKKLAADTDQ